MFAANTCNSRHPNPYLAESLAEVEAILNPRLGDLAIVTTEFGTSFWRLREAGDNVADGFEFLDSNSCGHLWVRSGTDDEFDGDVNFESLNAAIAAQEPIILPEGEFFIDGLVELSGNVSIQGQGTGRTILDFTTAPDGVALSGSGTLSALPALGGAVVIGQTSIIFAAAHNLAVGDVFIVHNTNTFSFNLARSFYYDGEYFKVASITNATTVTVTQPAYSNYSGAGIDVWKQNPISLHLKDVTLRFKQGLGAGFAGIQVSVGRDIILEDVEMSGSQYAQAYLDRCYEVRTENCRLFDNQATIGNNYGFLFGNCQQVKVITCEGTTTRHAISFGGGIADGSVPNRDVQIIGGHYSSLGVSWAVDFHGNCEHYQVVDVQAPGGLALGGDHGSVIGGRFGNYNASSYAIVLAEVNGLNFILDACVAYASQNFDNALISFFCRETFERPSCMDIKGVKIEMGTFSSSNHPISTTSGIEFGTIGLPLTTDITVNLMNVSCYTEVLTAGPVYAIRYVSNLTAGVPSGIRRINISGLDSAKAGIIMDADSESVTVENCNVPDALRYGIRIVDKGAVVAYSPQMWTIRDNNASTAMRDGIIFEGDPTATNAFISGNIAINCSQETAATYYSLRVDGANNATVIENNVGDIQAVSTQVGTYRVANISVLRDIRNLNLGSLINPALIRSSSGITTLIDDPPFDGPIWDYTNKGFNWGAAGASATIPYFFQKDANAAVFWSFRNKIALGNVSAGMGIEMEAGASGNSASGVYWAWPQDYNLSYRRGKIGLEANGDADAVYLAAPAAGQTIDAYAGSTTISFRLDGSVTAGDTRLLLLHVDTGTLKRVRAGAAGTGPGGVGYALFLEP